MVTCHGKLRAFARHNEIVQLVLLREFIAKSHAIVVYSETNNDVSLALWLVEVYLKFVVMIANSGRFSPHRLPSFIESGGLMSCFCEAIHEICLIHSFAYVLVFLEF